MAHAYLNSNLASMSPPVDVTVAVLPHSLDVQLHKTLAGSNLPTLSQYFIADEKGNPLQVSRKDLLASANGTDPFALPAMSSPDYKQAVANLRGAYFMYAFSGSLGLPPGFAPMTPGGPALPPVITPTNGQLATFAILFEKFTVVSMNYSPRGEPLKEISQATGTAWTADLLVSLADVAVTSGDLPQAVADATKGLGPDTFSVRQLLVDFTRAVPQSVKFAGLPNDPGITASLLNVYLQDFVTELRQYDWPPLSYNVVRTSTPDQFFPITSTQLTESPYLQAGTPVAQSALTTICYRCAVQGHKLPPVAAFNWNWLNAGDAVSADGVVAINRDTMATYFHRELLPYARQNCINVHASCKLNSLSQAVYEGSYTRGFTPELTLPATGATLLSMNYTNESFDQAGLHGDIGRLRLKSGFNLKVTVEDNTVVVTQQLTFFVKLRKLATTVQGYYFNTVITDTFTITVNSRGQLTAHHNSVSHDYSTDHRSGGCAEFWTKINHKIDKISDVGSKFFKTDVQPIPLSVVEGFYFPGGRTFTFADVQFSDNQDLVALINYARR